MTQGRKGLIAGAAGYLLWGAMPLYFPLLEPAGSLEMLAHRVAWSALTMVLVVVLLRRVHRLRAAWSPGRRRLLVGSAVAIGVNWGTYIYAVTHGHVVEASLGYFINPLVTVLAGVVLLGERMRPVQWVATGIAGAAVLLLTLDYGRPPWVALVLALAFATYGVLKKRAGVGSVEGLTAETLLLAPIALGWIGWITLAGTADLGQHGAGQIALFTTLGIVTAAPLLCFGAAATRIPLVHLGLLQYLTPTLQFLIGVYWFAEPMPPSRLIGFALVWTALLIFTGESISHYRRTVHRGPSRLAAHRGPARLEVSGDHHRLRGEPMALQDTDEIRTWLGDVDFPASKETLLEAARQNQAPAHVIEALRTIPVAEYGNRDDVAAATPSEAAQSDADKAEQARRHQHSGLAEDERQTPANPIVDELGENRGS